MSKTSFLLIGVLSLCSLAVAGSKSYNITLPVAAKAGALKLAAGDYTLKVDGTTATFVDPRTRKAVSAPIKLGTAAHKFNYTAVETKPEGGEERITSIDLAGSTTQIEFPKETGSN
jgi:hypothetical protein